MKKRIAISCVLSVAVLLMLLPGRWNGTEVYAASHTVDEAMAWCESQLNQKIGSGQCVAFVQAYYSYLGVTPSTGHAYQFSTNALPNGWSRVQGGVPQRGDILIYTGAKYGHVAIYAGGTVSYHQNMSGQYVEKKTSWNYDKSWYSSAEGGTKSYWGYIRPDFGSSPTTPTTVPTTPQKHDPIGCLDSVEVSGNMIVVKGWAFDYDNTAANIDIHVYIDNGLGGKIGIGSATANKGRPDVNDAYNGVGECHGFEAAFGSPSTGTFNVYVYALNNVGEGSDQLIGQRQVTVTDGGQPSSKTDIYGNYENAIADGTKITVVGWAFDKADTSKCTGIHVYIDDGKGGQQYVGGGGAVELRQDVDNVHHAGNNHGFYFSVNAPRTGTYKVYVYAISVDGTSSKLLGSKQVTVSSATIMSINKTVCRRNDKITFTFYSNISPTVYTIGIEKDGTRVITQNVTSPFSISTLDEGSYTAYVTASNPSTGSCESNKVSFTVSDMDFTAKKSVSDNGHTYTLYDGNLSWLEARDLCSELGGYLATITSEQEQKVIQNLLNNAQEKYYWIGLSDAKTEGNYEWVTGEARSYTNWCAGQPDNWNNAEDYIFILRDGGGWNDSGDLPLGFILEEKSTYTIAYNANGGTNAPEAQTKTHGASLFLSNNTPVRDGYAFLGWSKDKNAVAATYRAGAEFTEDEATTFYAIWEKIPSTHTPGDINGDSAVNNKDLTRLMKYLAGEDVQVDEDALDVNGDGTVNNKDLTRLMKYLAGDNVTIN